MAQTLQKPVTLTRPGYRLCQRTHAIVRQPGVVLARLMGSYGRPHLQANEAHHFGSAPCCCHPASWTGGRPAAAALPRCPGVHAGAAPGAPSAWKTGTPCSSFGPSARRPRCCRFLGGIRGKRSGRPTVGWLELCQPWDRVAHDVAVPRPISSWFAPARAPSPGAAGLSCRSWRSLACSLPRLRVQLALAPRPSVSSSMRARFYIPAAIVAGACAPSQGLSGGSPSPAKSGRRRRGRHLMPAEPRRRCFLSPGLRAGTPGHAACLLHGSLD